MTAATTEPCPNCASSSTQRTWDDGWLCTACGLTYSHPKEPVRAYVDRQYAETHARLGDDPEYQARTIAAERETLEAPTEWFARNMLAFYVELHMPPIAARFRPFIDASDLA